MSLGSIPTRHFFANETYFHLLLLAYNLVNWFKRLCLPDRLTERSSPNPAPPYLLDAGATALHRQPDTFDLARKRSPRSGLETCAPANQQTSSCENSGFHAGFRLNLKAKRLPA